MPLATSPADRPGPESHARGARAAIDGQSGRWWLANTALLGLVLVAAALSLGPGVFTIDEAAYHFQTDLVSEGTWGLDYPTDARLDQRVGAPLANSQLGPERWYPAARHPAYIHLLGLAQGLGQGLADQHGPLIVSIFGVVAAATGIERLTRWLGPSRPGVGFWLTGLGSPIAFHGLVAWAHAPAVGLMALGTAALLTSRREIVAVAGVGATSASLLLRGEAPIAVAALIVALLVGGRHHDRLRWRAGLTTAGATAAVLLDAWWRGSIVEAGTVSGPGTGRAIDPGRYARTAQEMLMAPGAGGLGKLRLVAVLLLGVAAVWLWRTGSRRSTPTTKADRHLLLGLMVAAVVAGVIGSTAAGAYGALLPAFPLVVALSGLGSGSGLGLGSGLGPSQADPDQYRRWLMLATLATLTIVGPVVGSLSLGGGLGWGGRYVLSALIGLIPLVVAGANRLWTTDGGRPLVVAALIITVAVQLSGFRTLHGNHHRSTEASAIIETELPRLAADVDLIVTADPRIGRLAPVEASSVALITVADSDALAEVLDLAAEQGLDRVAVVAFQLSPVDHGLPSVPGRWRLLEDRPHTVHALVLGR